MTDYEKALKDALAMHESIRRHRDDAEVLDLIGAEFYKLERLPGSTLHVPKDWGAFKAGAIAGIGIALKAEAAPTTWSKEPPEFEDGAMYWVYAPDQIADFMKCALVVHMRKFAGLETIEFHGDDRQHPIEEAAKMGVYWGPRLQVPEGPTP